MQKRILRSAFHCAVLGAGIPNQEEAQVFNNAGAKTPPMTKNAVQSRTDHPYVEAGWA
jgi:hypothetical protein